jgi:hypothetical protein
VRIALATLAVALAAGCTGSGAGSAPARGWVAGVALGGRSFCPAPTVTGLHCHSGPRPHALIVLTGASGRRTLRADDSGRFRVRVPAGRYAVALGRAHPVSVRVHSGRVTRVHVGGTDGR